MRTTLAPIAVSLALFACAPDAPLSETALVAWSPASTALLQAPRIDDQPGQPCRRWPC